ncbi:MAG: Tol-Pal system beta propeller repeat protein TolB [Nitrospiraceae bacterium]|nr:Tol-Pal system beta propeller repeat protein TolB [Nitrospiraceae bacterium]
MNKIIRPPLPGIILIALFAAFFIFAGAPPDIFSGAPVAQAKIYIDITHPERKVPVAISPLAGLGGGEIAKVVTDDLDYTGLFLFLDQKGFTETPEAPFQRTDWLSAQVDFVLKGTVNFTPEGEFLAQAALYDVSTGNQIFSRKYSAASDLIRPLAHSIADDIYQALTGSKSPFKSRLAFVTVSHGRRDLAIADWDCGRIHRLGFKDSIILTPRWSPDGGSLLYSARRGGLWGVYLLDLATMRQRAVFRASGTNLAGDIDARGDVVFSSSVHGSPNLYEMPSGGKLIRLTKTSGIDVSPAFSPDGSKIAFVSDRGGSPQIYIMNTDGYNISRLTFSGDYNTSPAWSPAGDRLVFVGRYQGRNQIFTIKADGSDLMLLTTSGNNEDPCFSPDGRLIAFASNRDGRRAIYVMRADGQGQKRLSPPGLEAYGPRWSK